MSTVDAIVVGAGPNGLAAAWTLARAGLTVEIFEKDGTLGGGCRTETWGDGFRSDWGSAVHPMALASPFFRELDLASRVRFAVPDLSYAHPLPGVAATAWRSLDRTVDSLGKDGRAWARLLSGLIARVDATVSAALSPAVQMLTHPGTSTRLGSAALRASCGAGLRTERGQALLAGVVAHSVARQPAVGPAAAGVVLAALAHTVGWPIPLGGSSAITDLLVHDLHGFGVKIHTDTPVHDVRHLPRARAYFFDTSARTMMSAAAGALRIGARYRAALNRMIPGNAVSKVDIVLSQPIPWSDSVIGQAGTVHLGGTRSEILRAEDAVARGRHATDPMVILSQPSIFDPSRTAEGLHSVWAYAHVPAGSVLPQTEQVLDAIERHAPGVRDLVVDSRSTTAAQISTRNPTMIGGDFASGAITLRQIVARPVVSAAPWRAGENVYLCSAATAPGPGVHGMGGYGAARAALRQVYRRPSR